MSQVRNKPFALSDIAEIFKEELSNLIGIEVSEININDALDDYGLDSINMVRLASAVGSRLGVDIDPILFHEIDSIQAIIDELVSMDSNNKNSEDNNSLNDDCILSQKFVEAVTQKNLQADLTIDKIFFTGATGFVGAYLVFELLSNTKANIKCLVRSNNEKEGLERIVKNLSSYGLWQEDFQHRLSVVLGSLEESSLGLEPSQFSALAKDIDCIVHCGANVNFIHSYKYLKSANVDSVNTILELAVAGTGKIKPIHLISTLGVVMSPGYDHNHLIKEDEELIHDHGLPNGYEQSKYVADKLVQKAIREYNIPANIYRLGMVSGDSKTGVYAKLNEFLPSFLKGCLQLGCWPEVDAYVEMVPVDFAAKAIVNIMANPKNLGKAFFALHPQPRKAKDIVNFYREQGYKIDILPWEQWKSRLFSLDVTTADNALLPFISFIKALSNVNTFFPNVDRTNFISSLDNFNYSCADQIDLLEKYNKHFESIGYYKAP